MAVVDNASNMVSTLASLYGRNVHDEDFTMDAQEAISGMDEWSHIQASAGICLLRVYRSLKKLSSSHEEDPSIHQQGFYYLCKSYGVGRTSRVDLYKTAILMDYWASLDTCQNFPGDLVIASTTLSFLTAEYVDWSKRNGFVIRASTTLDRLLTSFWRELRAAHGTILKKADIAALFNKVGRRQRKAGQFVRLAGWLAGWLVVGL